MCALSNILGAETVDLMKLHAAGKHDEAQKLQHRLIAPNAGVSTTTIVYFVFIVVHFKYGPEGYDSRWCLTSVLLFSPGRQTINLWCCMKNVHHNRFILAYILCGFFTGNQSVWRAWFEGGHGMEGIPWRKTTLTPAASH